MQQAIRPVLGESCRGRLAVGAAPTWWSRRQMVPPVGPGTIVTSLAGCAGPTVHVAIDRSPSSPPAADERRDGVRPQAMAINEPCGARKRSADAWRRGTSRGPSDRRRRVARRLRLPGLRPAPRDGHEPLRRPPGPSCCFGTPGPSERRCSSPWGSSWAWWVVQRWPGRRPPRACASLPVGLERSGRDRGPVALDRGWPDRHRVGHRSGNHDRRPDGRPRGLACG